MWNCWKNPSEEDASGTTMVCVQGQASKAYLQKSCPEGLHPVTAKSAVTPKDRIHASKSKKAIKTSSNHNHVLSRSCSKCHSIVDTLEVILKPLLSTPFAKAR